MIYFPRLLLVARELCISLFTTPEYCWPLARRALSPVSGRCVLSFRIRKKLISERQSLCFSLSPVTQGKYACYYDIGMTLTDLIIAFFSIAPG